MSDIKSVRCKEGGKITMKNLDEKERKFLITSFLFVAIAATDLVLLNFTNAPMFVHIIAVVISMILYTILASLL